MIDNTKKMGKWPFPSNMNEIIPRFEFRAFAYDFGLARDRLHHLATLEDIEEQADVYLITPNNHSHNVKVRDGRLDIKYLTYKKNGLEQWRPIYQAMFPLTASQLCWELFTSLNIVAPNLAYDSYDQRAFWDDLMKPQASICLVRVIKHRFRFNYRSCLAEISNLWVNGTPVQTLAIENEDDETVQELRTELDLQGYENVNYPQALQRMMGLTPHFTEPDTWLLHGGNGG
jgi:hypothetical protein